MANEKTLEILKEMKADPKAQELFEGMDKPASSDEMAEALAKLAGKLGYSITAEDIREAVKQENAKRKAKTDKAVSDIEEIDDDDLERVTGDEEEPDTEEIAQAAGRKGAGIAAAAGFGTRSGPSACDRIRESVHKYFIVSS